MNNYENLMLSLSKQSQKKDDERKRQNMQKAKEIADKEKNTEAPSSAMDATQERAAIGSYIYNLFVPKGKFYKVTLKGKDYYDTVKGVYTIRAVPGSDKWTIYKNNTLRFAFAMKKQNKYIFYVTEDALNSINVDEKESRKISRTIDYIEEGNFDYKFYTDYKFAKEILSELCLATSGKRNNIIEENFEFDTTI